MAGLIAKSFESPDEVRSPHKTKVEVVDLAGVKAGRLRVEPGWKWSECIKPVVGTESCQAHHTGKYLRGQTGRATEVRRPYTQVGSDDIVRDVVAISQEIGCSPAQVAVSWVRQQPGPVIP